MAKTEAFRDLNEVRAAKERLRAERDRVREGLKAQLELAGDPGFQKSLLGGVLGGFLRSWRPMKGLTGALGGSAGMAGGILGLVLGAKARTPMGRLLVGLASSIIPALIDGPGGQHDAFGPKLKRELGVSWERVKNYVNERRKARHESPSEE
jgi:hypothetical protein